MCLCVVLVGDAVVVVVAILTTAVACTFESLWSGTDLGHIPESSASLALIHAAHASVRNNNLTSLVTSLLLAISSRVYSSFLNAVMKLRPLSVIVSIHTSASNAVAFQYSAMPNASMSLCTQSVYYFCFPLRFLQTAPSRFPNIT